MGYGKEKGKGNEKRKMGKVSQFTKWIFDDVVNQDTLPKSLKNYC